MAGKNKRTYPENFPDGCPPDEAKPICLWIYRGIHGNQPTEDDFKSYIESGRYKAKNKKFQRYKFIEYGLSAFTSFEELKGYIEGSVFLKKTLKNIACGYTYKCNGVVQKTSSEKHLTHITWWIYEGVNPSKYFKTYRR